MFYWQSSSIDDPLVAVVRLVVVFHWKFTFCQGRFGIFGRKVICINLQFPRLFFGFALKQTPVGVASQCVHCGVHWSVT